MTGSRRIAAYLGGGCLLAAWLASAASTSRQAAVEPPPPSAPATSNTEALAAGVQAQAARLRQRIAGAPAPAAPARNPFVFAARELTAPRLAPRKTEPAPATDAPVPAEPQFALVGVAERLARAAGVPPDIAARLYLPLLGGAVANLNAMGPAAALTGAVRRGDEQTIRAHLKALSAEDRILYRTVSKAAITLAREAGLSEGAAKRVEEMLEKA